MRRREFLRGAAAAVPLAALADQPANAVPPSFALPKPQLQGGRPLMQALSSRQTNRNISDEKLSPQMLSNLLWAAWGVNRTATRGRTAPSAMNVQEIDLYVFLAEGVYLFDAPSQSLKPLLAGDHRAGTGSQDGVGKAPVSLVFVADLDKYGASRGGRGAMRSGKPHGRMPTAGLSRRTSICSPHRKGSPAGSAPWWMRPRWRSC